MELDPPHSIEVITVTTTSNPGGSGKNVIPLQIELEKFPSQQELDGHDNKMRRPVRPIDRQRMRPWLMELLDVGNVFGLHWTNRHQGIFQISWRHASRLGWNLETDGDVFERWARHTGIYKEGDPPEPKRWKANFRCALHSLNDVMELTNAIERRGRNACRTYRFLQSGDDQVAGRKRAKAKKMREAKLTAYERSLYVTGRVGESTSSEEALSESEGEEPKEDKVIVQQLDTKTEIAGEDYGLHHDHDYSAAPEKIEKTIVLRQGIGSIVLQKEVVTAMETMEVEDAKTLLISNLDQLASAAMSSASLQTKTIENPQDPQSTKAGRRHKQKLKKKLLVKEEEEEMEKSDFSLRHLLLGTKLKGLEEVNSAGPASRKRKGASSTDMVTSGSGKTEDLIYTRGRKRKGPESTSVVEASQLRLSNPPSSSVTRQRNERGGSPKIRGRKVRKARHDDGKADASEPLMSSCLLLLEAATRLDNAEKISSSTRRSGSLPQNSASSRKQKQSSSGRTIVGAGGVDTGGSTSPETSDQDSVQTQDRKDVPLSPSNTEDLSDGNLVSDEPIQDVPQGILRSTLEKTGSEPEMNAVRPKSRTIRNILSNSGTVSLFNAVGVSDGKMVVSEASEAKGLFSGSNIQSKECTPSVSRKRGKGRGNARQSRTKYFVDIRTNSRPGNCVANQIAVNETGVGSGSTDVAESNPSVVNVSTVKSNSGVQQTIIQRALPVLSAPAQKVGVPSSEVGAPVVIAHKVSGLAGTPQILMSSSAASSTPPVVLPLCTNQRVAIAASDVTSTTTILQSDGMKTTGRGRSLIPAASFPQDMKLRVTQATILSRLPNIMASPRGSSVIASTVSSPPIIAPFKTTPSLYTSGAGVGHPPIQPSMSQLNVRAVTTLGPRTIILTRPQNAVAPLTPPTSSTGPGNKKDILVFEQSRDAHCELKLHVVPLQSTSHSSCSQQTSTMLSSPMLRTMAVNSDGIQSSSSSSLAGSNCVSVTAQVVIDPIKGTMLKFPLGPSVPVHPSLIRQAHVFSVPTVPSVDTVSTVSANMSSFLPTKTVSNLSTAPVVIGGKSFTMDASRTTGPEDSTPKVSHSSLFSDKMNMSSSLLKLLGEVKVSTEASIVSSSSVQANSVDNLTSLCTHTQDNSSVDSIGQKLSSHVSLLRKQPLPTAADTSIVMDFQQALLAHKLSVPDGLTSGETVLSTGSYVSVCEEDSSQVKPLTELCKRLLAQLFKSLDNQSESDASDSPVSSPCIDIKQEYVSDNPEQIGANVELSTSSVEGWDSKQEYASDIQGNFHIKTECSTAPSGESVGVSDLANSIECTVVSSCSEELPEMYETTLPETVSLDLIAQIPGSDCQTRSSALVGGDVLVKREECEHVAVAPEASEEYHGRTYHSQMVMDPTAPLSLGEVPLFAFSKGDSDSLSPTSDTGC